MQTIILSAFKKFGDYKANSTELVAKELNNIRVGEFTIHSVIFNADIPKENQGVFLLSMAQKLNAKGIISLGMASEKIGLCVERVATNKIYNSKYCPPSLNETAIDTSRPYEEKIELSLLPWNIDLFKKVCLEKEIPVMQESSYAGGFCCNHLAYQIGVAQMESSVWNKIPFIFIHTPCSPESLPDPKNFYSNSKTTMPIEKISEGIKILILNAEI